MILHFNKVLLTKWQTYALVNFIDICDIKEENDVYVAINLKV